MGEQENKGVVESPENLDDKALEAYLKGDTEKKSNEVDKDVENKDTDIETKDNKEVDVDTEEKEKKEEDKYGDMSKEELVSLLEKKTKQVDDKEKYIQQRSTEIGLLRQQLRAKQVELEADVPKEEDLEFNLEDPKSSVEKMLEQNERRKTREQKRNELKQQEMKLEVEQFVLTADPSFYDKMDDMVEVIVEEYKLPRTTAIQFKSDPFSTDPGIIMDILRKAEKRKLMKEIEDLKKKPNDLVKKIEETSKMRPLKPSTRSQASKQDIGSVDLANMTTEQLNKFIEERSKEKER